MELRKLKKEELLSLYGTLMEELLFRGIIRTVNNPVADYGEYVAATRLNLKLTNNSCKGYDAVDLKNNRYQIKTRRFSERNKSLQLGVIRNIENNPFDFLIAVIFNADFSVNIMWKLPIQIIKEHARFSKHQNGHILMLKGKILENPKSIRIV